MNEFGIDPCRSIVVHSHVSPDTLFGVYFSGTERGADETVRFGGVLV